MKSSEEENPMIGWRSTSRYYDSKYRPAFELECKGLLKARNDMGLTNIKLMVPFCRTPEEGKKVIQVMRECGLVQGENGLELHVMCEIPSNIICADAFADISKRRRRKIGICGQGPSDFPDFENELGVAPKQAPATTV